MSFEKQKTFTKPFIKSQFNYCPLILMFHSRITSKKRLTILNSSPPTTTHHHPPPPMTIHQQPPLATIYPPPSTTTQKMDHHWAKAKIYSCITSFWHCFNSFVFFKMRYVTEILCDKVLIRSFFKFKISATFYDISDFLKFILQEFKVTRFIFVCFYK